MPGFLFGRPSANIAPLATPSWTVGTEQALYPVENALTLDPGEVAKANEDDATLRLTFGAGQTFAGVIVIHTNQGGSTLTLTTSAGMAAQAKTVPAPEDDRHQSVWFDLRGIANASGTWLDLAFTGGADPVAVGTVIVLTEWLEPRVRWEYEVLEDLSGIVHENSYGTRQVVEEHGRVRTVVCLADWAEDRNLVRSLYREAGLLTAFPVVVDEDDEDDVILVQVPEGSRPEAYTFHHGSFSAGTAEGEVRMRLEFLEVHPGMTL